MDLRFSTYFSYHYYIFDKASISFHPLFFRPDPRNDMIALHFIISIFRINTILCAAGTLMLPVFISSAFL